jgi:HTH-type transcriptional regulator/antitoxin HigA
MIALTLKQSCLNFAQSAAPYLHIQDDTHYKEALVLIESLLEEADDSVDDPINVVIDILGHAIEAYENQDEELVEFGSQALEPGNDLALLRVLMDQHNLGMGDLPEIGSKSMVSRVLSGQRELSKKHIMALSERFGIEAGLFF